MNLRLAVVFCGVWLLCPLAIANDSLNTETSVVDYLKALGRDANLKARAALWKRQMPQSKQKYTGTATQNIALLKSLRSSGGIVADKSVPMAPKGNTLVLGTPSAATPFCVVFSAYATKWSLGKGASLKTWGHAWVLLGRKITKGSSDICVGGTFGMWPTSPKGANPLNVVFGVEGKLLKGWSTNAAGSKESDRAHVAVWVNQKKYDASMKVLRKWLKVQTFKFPGKVCTSFAEEIAGAVGLKQPKSKTTWPHDYLIDLAKKNKP